MRCLHCGKRLTLLRKLSDAEFCSEAHRSAFGQEQEQLALSRLIDAQQQSQQAPRRHPRNLTQLAADGNLPLEPAPIDFAENAMGALVTIMPVPTETEWRGYRKESMDPLLADAPVIPPRLYIPSRSGRVPVGGSVWPDIFVHAFTGTLIAVPHQVPECIEPAFSVTCLDCSGLSVLWSPRTPDALAAREAPDTPEAPAAGAKTDSATEPAVIAPAPRESELPPLQAGPVRWSVTVATRNYAPVPRTAEALPTPFRRGPDTEALPRAALAIVADSSPDAAIPDLSGDSKTLFRLAPPLVRSTLPGDAISGCPEWLTPLNLPRNSRLRGANLRRPGCLPLRIEKLTTGSYVKVDIREDAVPLPMVCVFPQQGIPRGYNGLRQARRLDLTIPQAAWGYHLQNVYPEPEPALALVVPPHSQGPRLARFNPPMNGVRQLRLTLRPGRKPVEYLRPGTLGPVYPAPVQPTRPPFSARVLCDWVPVQAPSMPLPCAIAPRGAKCGAAPRTGDASQPETIRAAAPSAPLLRPQAAGTPTVKGAANRMRKINLDAMVPRQSATAPKPLLDPSNIDCARILPRLKLRVVKDSPSLEIERRLQAPAWSKALYRAADVWAGISPLTKAAGVLMMLLLVVFLASPGSRQAAAGANLQASLSGGWETVQHNIWKRAAISLTDDFRAGLADWEGPGDWARQWSYDQSGFVRTGPMALFTPSLQLTDYRMEFLGQIEKRSLGWAVRAADSNNYYAVKLVISDPGPVPSVVIQRWAVIDGKPGPILTKRLPMEVRLDTLYRVTMDLRGSDFTLSVQGNMVDSWTEPRLTRGGIGFFSARGELSRLRWVGVWHQYDTLGRLCALLAPQSIADRERGVSQ